MVKFIIYLLLAFVAWQFLQRLLAQLGFKPSGREAPQARGARGANRQAAPAEAGAQDLVRCAVCGSYVAARCGRTNCPQ